MEHDIKGIKVSNEEIRSFQAVFPSSPASSAMNKIIQKHMEYWNDVSMNMTASDSALRNAQGALATLMAIDNDVRALLKFNLEQEDVQESVEEEEEDAGPELF